MAGVLDLPAKRADSTKQGTVKIAPDALAILRKISGLAGMFMEDVVSELVRTSGQDWLKRLVDEEQKRLQSPKKSHHTKDAERN